MIEKMEKLFLYGLSADNERLLSDLMQVGCAEIVEPETLAGQEEIAEELSRRISDLYNFEQLQSRLGAAIGILAPYTPKKKLLDRRPQMDYHRLADAAGQERALEICARVEEIQKEIGRCQSDIGRTEFLISSLMPWKDLDIPLDERSTHDSEIFLLMLPLSAAPEELTGGEESIRAVVQEISRDTEQIYAAAVCHKSQTGEFWDRMRSAGGVKVEFDKLTGTVAENMAAARRELERLETELARYKDSLKETAGDILVLQETYDACQMAMERARAAGRMLHTAETSLLTAWVPQRQKARVERVLEKYQCFYEFSPPGPEEEPPVLLKNNKLVEPFEAVTEMYSMPAPGSLDPNPVMAPYFFLFFGMMLSDAGYGLILTVVGLLGAKLLDCGAGMKKLLKMLGYCGISTVFWGALYGSWFGDAIPRVASVFFGADVKVPMLIDPLTDPMSVLILSFIFGYLHIMTGLVLKAYLMIRRGHPLDAFFDVGLWMLILIGLPLLLAGGLAAQIGQYLAIGGAVGLVLTQGRDKKNPLLKAASGVLSLYDITGYFSDLLSYSRIMALGLATGVIGQVVNTMGTLPGRNIFGALLFVVVFAGGHVLNLGINALGSYVHSSRLQYVEFFGKFFEGGGQPFRPLRADTKYVYIKQEEQ